MRVRRPVRSLSRRRLIRALRTQSGIAPCRYQGSRDTYLRIHGSPHPTSIGGRASSGCVRMVMAHINDLYPNVKTGVTAYLYPPEDMIGARS